jgi:sugar transferase (PEP-CTERM/EpsH1 system associated)
MGGAGRYNHPASMHGLAGRYGESPITGCRLMPTSPQPPLVAHVIHRLGVGGLENGLVNLVNRLPEERYRHAIVCLTDATDFRIRIRRPAVTVHELHRREGQDLRLPFALYRLFRVLRPAIVHTRNLAAIESQIPAWLAGVPGRVHSEHGWDVFDPDGSRRKYQWLRRLHKPLVQRFVGLSEQLVGYLRDRVGVPPAKLLHICNGVDAQRFAPAEGGRTAIPGCPFAGDGLVVFGTVGRMHGVKDQLTLVRAFLRLREQDPGRAACARLVLVGEGPLRAQAAELLAAAGAADAAWLPGERADIPVILQGLDVFVLPSQAEGISNTILEAMATGLPVVATAVGGNTELVIDGECGRLVPPSAPEALAMALAAYLADRATLRAHGAAARRRAETCYGIDKMVRSYQELYDGLLPGS